MISAGGDRKSTRLNSSHDQISYAVLCLKKKKAAPALERDAAVCDQPAPGAEYELRPAHGERNHVLKPADARSHRPWRSFFFKHPPTTEIYTLSLHDALPIYEVLGTLPVRIATSKGVDLARSSAVFL